MRGWDPKKVTQIYFRLPVFGKCLKWVFQVCLRRFSVGRDSIEVKKIIKVKFFWIIAATAGRFYVWVSVLLEKSPRDSFRGTLSLVAVPKWFHNGFFCLYSSKRWQSVSWCNLDKDFNGIKDFFKKKQFFLYWVRHSYQSKTCVEHIAQVIDKSLMTSTNSSMNLLYFLHMKVTCFKYCKKCMRIQIEENLSLKLSFLAKPTFAKGCASLSASHFQDYYVLLLVSLVLNRFYYWFYWF